MKNRTVLFVLFLVLILGGGWFVWQTLSDKEGSDEDTAEISEMDNISVISDITADIPVSQEPASEKEYFSDDGTYADDLPEGDAGAEGMAVDPGDLPEGDARADDLPEGDADIPAEDPDAPAGDSLVNTAPDFRVLDMDGQEVYLSDLFGQRILINFWATWCPPCRAELPYFEEAYQKYGKDIVFLMVDLTDGSSETVAGVKAFASENGYTFPVYYDTEFSAAYAYGIDAIPQTFAIGTDGNVLMSQVGSMSQSRLKEFTDILLDED